MASRPLEGLHVVIVPTWYPTPEAPTGGLVFTEYLACFAQAGAKVGLIYPDVIDLENLPLSVRDPNYESRVREMGMPARPWRVLTEERNGDAFVVRIRGMHFSFRRKESRIDRFAGWLRRGYAYYVARQGAPDVLHPHCALPAGWAALRLARSQTKRPRVVLTEHTGPFGLLLRTPALTRRTLEACREADAVAAVGPRLRADMQAAGITCEMPIIPNPSSPLFQFSEMPAPRVAPGGKRSFTGVFVGRLVPDKGIPELAEAITRLAGDKELDLRWEIFGEGPEMPRLAQLFDSGPAKELGKLHGIRGKEEIAAVLRESHFLVLPSHYENSPMVVIEALSAGRPVVGSSVEGIEYLVKQDDGVLFEPKSAEDLARAVRDLVLRRWDARAIAERAQARFGWTAIADQYASLFRPSAAPSSATRT